MNRPFEPKDMSGVLFKNTKKKTGSKQPDYTGYLTVGGGRFQAAGWKKPSKSGENYISIKIALDDSECVGDL